MDDTSVIKDNDRLPYCSNTSSSFTENENLGIVQRRRKHFEEIAKQSNECCVLKNDGTWIKGSVSKISDINDDEDIAEISDSFDDESESEFDSSTEAEAFEEEINDISFFGTIPNIIDEIKTSEERYIQNLKLGFEYYVNPFDNKKLPVSLKGQKYRIFSVIERILDFHEHTFLPAILESNNDVKKIAEVFIKYIKEDYFRPYVVYAINKPKSEIIYKKHLGFFKELQDNACDRLGVHSFLLQPISRLSKYKLFLDSIFGQIEKNLERGKDFKEAIESCCIADKELECLLKTVNESISINDVEFSDDEFFNLLEQGSFLKCDEFDIYDKKLQRKYKGKVFLFAKSVVYTETIKYDEKRVNTHYRGNYHYQKLGISRSGKDLSKVSLFVEKKGNGRNF